MRTLIGAAGVNQARADLRPIGNPSGPGLYTNRRGLGWANRTIPFREKRSRSRPQQQGDEGDNHEPLHSGISLSKTVGKKSNFELTSHLITTSDWVMLVWACVRRPVAGMTRLKKFVRGDGSDDFLSGLCVLPHRRQVRLYLLPPVIADEPVQHR